MKKIGPVFLLLLAGVLFLAGGAFAQVPATEPGAGTAGGSVPQSFADSGSAGTSPDSVNLDSKIEDIIYRVAVAEGFFVAGSRPARNNNPGDLEEAGDLGVDSGGYGVFSSASQSSPYVGTGWDAARNQWRLIFTGASKYYSPDWTWAQIAQSYDRGGDWQNWLNNVGLDGTQVVNDWLNS